MTTPVGDIPPGPTILKGSEAAGLRIAAIVAGRGAAGLLVTTAEGQLLLKHAPELPEGARLLLQLKGAAGLDRPQAARLLAVDGQVLSPPRALRLSPLPQAPPRDGAGMQTSARILTPAGTPDGPPVRLRILAMPAGAAPIAAPAAGQALMPGSVMRADVQGQDALGRLILHASGLMLRLEATGIDLPARAAVLLQVLRPAAPGRGDDPARALLQSLDRAGDGARALLPRPDARFAASLLRFLEIAREGRAPSTTGEAPRGLREALTELQRIARESLADGWRGLPVPVEDHGRLGLLRLHWREDGGKGAREPGARRLILDLDLEALGRLQLDALSSGIRLDLIVRSERPLPEALAAELAALFQAACETTGLGGRLALQQGLLALPDPLPAAPDLTV